MGVCFLAGRPSHVAAGQHMEMQVLDGLAGLVAAVIDNAVALAAQFFADLGDHFEDVCHQGAVLCVDHAGAADMLLGHHQEVDGSLRLDVIESEAQLVFVQLLGRDLTLEDLTENAVFHK